MAHQAASNNRDEGGGTEEDSVLRLRWNSHVESLQQLFENLLEQQLFVDVTLACEGGSLKAHKVMLSACSTYFRRVLHETGSKNPVIIMRDVSYSEMDFILQFIYRGEIHVPEARLPSLLKTARLLEIRGLSDKLDQPFDEAKPSETESRKRRNSDGTTNGFHSPPHSPQVNGKAKKPTQTMAKEEELDNEDMDSDFDETDHAQINNDHQMKNEIMDQRLTPPTPLDLSNGEIGASDEENEIPSGHQSDKKKSASPVPVHVKCEAPELNQSQQGADEDDEEEEDDTVHPDQYPFSMLADSDQSGGGGAGVVVQAVCPFCFKDCKRTAELRAHIRAHTGEKPFRCDICSAPFARSAHLKRHRRVHTGERPFECHRCQKTFSRQDKLKLHMDRHRLRDTGGKMIVGRPKKIAAKKNEEQSVITPSTSSASSSTPTAVELTGMGQFAFPGAPARSGPPQSPNGSNRTTTPSPGLPYTDMNYFSLLSLSQRGLTISSATSQSAQQSDLPSPTVPNLLSPQALQELTLFRQGGTNSNSTRGRQQRSTRSTAASSNRSSSRSSVESASETLLNFAQQVGEVAVGHSSVQSS